MEKRRNCSLGAISPLFHNIFNISLTLASNYIFILLKVVVRLIVFLSFTNLICRSTDISKCFIESPGVRDNESRLYTVYSLLFCLFVELKFTAQSTLLRSCRAGKFTYSHFFCAGLFLSAVNSICTYTAAGN